jgi:hypothetical protein
MKKKREMKKNKVKENLKNKKVKKCNFGPSVRDCGQLLPA